MTRKWSRVSTLIARALSESPVFVGRTDTLTDLFRRVSSYGRPSAAVVDYGGSEKRAS